MVIQNASRMCAGIKALLKNIPALKLRSISTSAFNRSNYLIHSTRAHCLHELPCFIRTMAMRLILFDEIRIISFFLRFFPSNIADFLQRQGHLQDQTVHGTKSIDNNEKR